VEHGCKIRKESARQSREGDARAEARHAQERKLGQEGEEPQAGHRHRIVGSAPRRRQSAIEEVVFEEVELEEVVLEKVFVEEIFFEEVDQEVIEEIFEEVDKEEVAERSAYICVNLRIRLPA
jgi:hypothetical protein